MIVLTELDHACHALGQHLVTKIGDVTEVFENLSQHYDIHCIYAHEETGNGWTFQRDQAVINYCNKQNIQLNEYPCNGIVRRLKDRDHWSKIRNARMYEDLIPKPKRLIAVPNIASDPLPSKDHDMFGAPVPGISQPGGRQAAEEAMKVFLQENGEEYLYRLSAPGPSEKYCSRLSTHLTWGTLSVREVVKSTQTRRNALSEQESKSWKRNLSAFNSRLSWRCHFIQKIEDQPSIEFKCMHPAFEGMREPEHNEQFYQAWMEGNTGYPFIDACMRNLIHEGWITFRMRAMLVSFASYHLWLDWRKTGYHLARLFTDYEPGIHYSQLQMQSGVTGINAIRIYSPIKQSLEHDPEGTFIRQWVPELEKISSAWIHEPWLMNITQQEEANCIIGDDYPKPLVDHASAIKLARQKLGQARKKEGFRDDASKVYNKLGSRKRTPRKPKKKASDNEQQLSLKI